LIESALTPNQNDKAPAASSNDRYAGITKRTQIVERCPLYPRKRISLRVISMSAKHARKRPQRRPSGGSALRRFGASAFFNFETVNRFDPELLGLLGSRHGA